MIIARTFRSAIDC